VATTRDAASERGLPNAEAWLPSIRCPQHPSCAPAWRLGLAGYSLPTSAEQCNPQ